MALHMSTIVSRKTPEILAHISQLRPSLSAHPLLYTISTSRHITNSDLSQLVSSVQSLSTESIGCLSASVPSTRFSRQDHSTVSLASFDGKSATLFRSTVPGQKAAQVGRWHALHQKDEQPDTKDYSQAIDWDNALSRSYECDALPPAIQSLSAPDVNSVIYLTDNAPEGLNSALSVFTSATKLGLVASSTPFVTGRPYTLFHNDSIYSDGAVGICLSSPVRPRSRGHFPGLEAITRPMLVTNAKGNMVNALDGANPSRLLLHAIQHHPAASPYAKQNRTKELQVYLGTLSQQGHTQEPNQLFYITSGDPSRGSIALDADAAPSEGALVQMFLLPHSAKPDVLSELEEQAGSSKSLIFASASLEDLNAPITTSEDYVGDETIVLRDTFVAASENGYIASRVLEGGKSERPWKCTVPGGLMGLTWTE